MDDFCDHLDPLSAACCAASLGRHLRHEGRTTRAVLACSHARIVHWLRPDAVLICRQQSPPVLLRVGEPMAAALPLQVEVHAGAPPSTDAAATSTGGELFLSALRRCGLRLRLERCYDDAPPFRHDAAHEPPAGGHVLAARVQPTEATVTHQRSLLPSMTSMARPRAQRRHLPEARPR